MLLIEFLALDLFDEFFKLQNLNLHRVKWKSPSRITVAKYEKDLHAAPFAVSNRNPGCSSCQSILPCHFVFHTCTQEEQMLGMKHTASLINGTRTYQSHTFCLQNENTASTGEVLRSQLHIMLLWRQGPQFIHIRDIHPWCSTHVHLGNQFWSTKCNAYDNIHWIQRTWLCSCSAGEGKTPKQKQQGRLIKTVWKEASICVTWNLYRSNGDTWCTLTTRKIIVSATWWKCCSN